MRILREYAGAAGTLLLVVAVVMATLAAPAWTRWSIGLLGAALLLAGLVLNRARVAAFVTGRRARAASASLGYVVTVLGVVVLVNFLGGRHHARVDLTENQAFTLSEQTTRVLESLPREVNVTAFYEESGPARQKFRDLLDEYRIRSDRFRYEIVDPVTHPAEARRYGITETNTTVVESGKQEARFTGGDEEALTNALIKVLKDRERVLYVVTGHGERSVGDLERGGLSQLKSALEKQHYVVKPLALSEGVPADASAVLLAGPVKPFLEAEARMIAGYLKGGGRVFWAQDPDTSPGLAPALDAYGIAVREDVVIDKVSQLFGGDARIPMVQADGYDEFHAITKTFRFQTFYPLASSIRVNDSLPEGVTATKLAQTSPYSWGETDEAQFRSGRMQLDEGRDTRGPVVLGVALSRKAGDAPPPPAEGGEAKDGDAKPAAPETRLVVFGDSDFLTNGYINAAGNGDLALNSIAWLCEQEELVSIRPKTATPRIVILTPRQVFYYFWTIVAVAPIAILVTGVGIWVRRRRL